MTDYCKPLPTISEDNAPFWVGLRAQELRLQCCGACGKYRYPISPICPRCLSGEFIWQPVTGHGRVFSFVIFHRAYHRGFEADVPYNVALIRLDEGVFMFSNIVGITNDEIECDMPVVVDYERVTETITLPKFRRAHKP